MGFEFSSEVQELTDIVRRFAKDRLAPSALERAHDPEYPWDVARQMGEQGLLGLSIPEEKGGQGASLSAAVSVIMTVASQCPRSADIVQAGNFGAIRTFAEYASPELREKYLDSLLSGESLMGLSMTEPEAGSAATELETSAKPSGKGYVINGSKIFGTHSVEARSFLVYLRFGPGTDGIGSIIVDRDTEGLEISPPSQFMNSEQWSQLFFTNCYVDSSQVLLGPGGFKQQISGFNVERLGNASRSLAVGRYAFDLAVEYVLHREQFGRPLAEFQGLQWKFVDAYERLESAELLLMRAVEEADAGLPSANATALAKLATNEAGFAAANVAVQSMGGLGFSEESLVEYCFRRTRGWMIAGGSTEILKNRIAESVFGRRFSQRGPKAAA